MDTLRAGDVAGVSPCLAPAATAALPSASSRARLPGRIHRPAYRGDCGGWWPRRKPSPASRALWRPVGRRPGSGRAGGAAGAGPSRRAACRRLPGRACWSAYRGDCGGWSLIRAGNRFRLRGRGRTSRLAGLSCRYVSRGPGAAGSSRRAAASVRRAYPFRSRRCARAGRRGCSGSTRLRYRRDTAGELDSVIGAVEGVSRSSGFAPALPVRFGAGMAGGFCSMRIPVPCLAPAATAAIPPGLTRPLRRESDPERSVGRRAGGFADVSIGRRIAGIAGSGSRTGNRFRRRGRSGVPWGAVRGVARVRWCGRGGSVP